MIQPHQVQNRRVQVVHVHLVTGNQVPVLVTLPWIAPARTPPRPRAGEGGIVVVAALFVLCPGRRPPNSVQIATSVVSSIPEASGPRSTRPADDPVPGPVRCCCMSPWESQLAPDRWGPLQPPEHRVRPVARASIARQPNVDLPTPGRTARASSRFAAHIEHAGSSFIMPARCGRRTSGPGDEVPLTVFGVPRLILLSINCPVAPASPKARTLGVGTGSSRNQSVPV
ncbi:MAG: hypothetical protein Ct9H300mP1_35330 [Planctomycetaceae bacterium]|nr:MAG: hypothetical protein Ct9H300mP1_35330 [Planctomycetaceae bacterium]